MKRMQRIELFPPADDHQQTADRNRAKVGGHVRAGDRQRYGHACDRKEHDRNGLQKEWPAQKLYEYIAGEGKEQKIESDADRTAQTEGQHAQFPLVVIQHRGCDTCRGKQPAKPQPKQDIATQQAEEKPVPFAYWQDVIDIIADVDIPLHSFIKNSTAYLYKSIVYIKGNEGLNNYIRTNKEVNGIIKNAIFTASGKRYNIGGFKNIAHMFVEAQHDSINDILALRNLGVEVNID